MMKRYLKCLILTDRGRSWSSFRVKSGIISFWCSTDFSSPFFPFFISNLSSVIFNLFINTFLLYDWIFMNINLSHHCYCSVEFIYRCIFLSFFESITSSSPTIFYMVLVPLIKASISFVIALARRVFPIPGNQ